MNWWIVKQLRAAILMDLRDFISQDYFESEVYTFRLHNGLENSDYYSRELRWGYLATKLGKNLFFESTTLMSARQVSASETLMFLGLLAGVEAMLGTTKQLAKQAQLRGAADGNAGEVAEKLSEKQLPTALNNIKRSLERYLRHLTPLEAQPFLPLLDSIKYKEHIVDEHPNVSLLIKRMTTALENNDPASVLHTSASIFETLAKDIIDIDSIQDKPLGAFFERYRKNSMLPEEILNYIESIYKRRNTEPLAGHGSTALPEITLKEATIIVELTNAFVRIERTLQIVSNYQETDN